MLRNEKVEMAHDYQDKLTEIDVLKAEVQRLIKVEDENKMLRLVFDFMLSSLIGRCDLVTACYPDLRPDFQNLGLFNR